MHRKLGNKDLYAVYNVPSGTECFFRATGGIELWDPWTGKTKEITASKTTDEGTIIQMPMEKQDLHLFVFDPAQKAIITEVPQTSVSKTGLRPMNCWALISIKPDTTRPLPKQRTGNLPPSTIQDGKARLSPTEPSL